MSPAELAERHPQLFHVTTAGASERIRRFGLMSTSDLLTFLGVDTALRTRLTTQRRPKEEVISHSQHGDFFLGNNAPLSEKRLAGRLEDNLTFSSWLEMLNDRVFFWTEAEARGNFTEVPKLPAYQERTACHRHTPLRPCSPGAYPDRALQYRLDWQATKSTNAWSFHLRAASSHRLS